MTPARFEEQVARHPARPALQIDDETIVYEALNRSANRIAHALAGVVDCTQAPVAVVTREVQHATAAILGTLKAGNVCVPMDPAMPASRLAAIADDAGVAAVLTSGASRTLAHEVASGKRPVLTVDDLDGPLSESDPTIDVRGEDLAWLLYTSGSTGAPKGVLHDHKNLLASVDHWSGKFDYGPDDRFAHLSPMSHVSAINDMLKPLLNGGCMVALDLAASSLGSLARLVVDRRVTVLHCIPSVFRAMTRALEHDDDLSNLRLIHLGGEPLFPTDVQRFRRRFPADCVLVNNLGSTEIPSFIQNVIGPDAALDTPVVPVGFPVPGKRVRLIDSNGEEVAHGEIGEIGEIEVSSPYLALGYWKNPVATAERFVEAGEGQPERSYRTGDLGRRRADGAIEFLGRRDDQIKVRGHRVELGEVQFALERAAQELGGFRETTVVPGELPSGARCVVAYVVSDAGSAFDESRLRAAMAAALPRAMRPEAYVELAELPRTRNGKIDRAALPAPRRETNAAVGDGAIRSPVASQLAELWSQLLATGAIANDADFFDLGGDSMLALELTVEIERLFGRRLSLPELAGAATLESMAALIGKRRGAEPAPCLVPLKTDGNKDALVLVHGLGGGVIQMRELARRLDPDRPVYALQARGIDGVSPPLRGVCEMAAVYLEELQPLLPEGPLLLGGYSMGGVVAYEMAQRLAANGRPVRSLVLIDAGAPLPLPWRQRIGHSFLYGRIVLRRLRARRGGRRNGYARSLNRVMLANFRAVRRYRPRTYDGAIDLVASERTGAAAVGDARERELMERLEQRLVARRALWDRLAPGRVRVHPIDGHHLELWRPPALDGLVSALRGILEA